MTNNQNQFKLFISSTWGPTNIIRKS